VADAPEHFDACDAAVRANVKREQSAACEMLASSLWRIFRSLRVVRRFCFQRHVGRRDAVEIIAWVSRRAVGGYNCKENNSYDVAHRSNEN